MRACAPILAALLCCASLTPLASGVPEIQAAWEAGRKAEAINRLLARARVSGREGVIYGQVINPDGSPATAEQRDVIMVLVSDGTGRIFNHYWAADGSFLFQVPAGRCRVVAVGASYKGGTDWFDVPAGESVRILPMTLGGRSLAAVPRARLALEVELTGRTDRSGITVVADTLDQNEFVAVTDAGGKATIEVPAVPGRWRVTSRVPGYAEIWTFVNLKGPEMVDLGRYELTPLKQVTIRWRAPARPKSRRLDKDATEGRVTLRSYDEVQTPDGPEGRELSFELREVITTSWDVKGDLELCQAGDAVPLVEIAPRVYRTSSLEFFPGTKAHVKPGKAALADLGPADLDALTEIPRAGLKPYHDRKGLPVEVGHVYAWRSFDGKRYAAFLVESVEDLPPPE